MTTFPADIPGRLRVAYLIAETIATQGRAIKPRVNDRGDGRVYIHGSVDLGLVVDALLAAAPPEPRLWWNDGPILDQARAAVVEVMEKTAEGRGSVNFDFLAGQCAAAALQVAHRAGYAPVRSPVDGRAASRET